MAAPGPVRDPDALAGDREQCGEFGVPVGRLSTLARKKVPPDDGAPYRGMAPGEGRYSQRESDYPGKWVAP